MAEDELFLDVARPEDLAVVLSLVPLEEWGELANGLDLRDPVDRVEFLRRFQLRIDERVALKAAEAAALQNLTE